MNKTIVVLLFLISGSVNSYCQRVQYKDLVGFSFSVHTLQKIIIQIEFKDSLHAVLNFGGEVSDLTYKLNEEYGVTIVDMKETHPKIYAPGYDNGGGGAGFFFLIKKADGPNFKIQGFSAYRPREWDDNETNKNTFLMTPIKQMTLKNYVNKSGRFQREGLIFNSIAI